MKYLTLISEVDADILKEFAAQITVDGVCLEIGSGQGASSVAILSGLPEPYSLVCSSYHNAKDYLLFRENCLEHGVWNRVIPVTGDFRNVRAHVAIDRLAFVFVDHDHTKQGMEDFGGIFLSSCVPGTLLLFHDYNNTAYPAVMEWVDALDPKMFTKIKTAGDTVVIGRI